MAYFLIRTERISSVALSDTCVEKTCRHNIFLSHIETQIALLSEVFKNTSKLFVLYFGVRLRAGTLTAARRTLDVEQKYGAAQASLYMEKHKRGQKVSMISLAVTTLTVLVRRSEVLQTTGWTGVHGYKSYLVRYGQCNDLVAVLHCTTKRNA